MIRAAERWIGRDLHPLPYDSGLSVIWRFAWCNSLAPAQLTRYTGNLWQRYGEDAILRAAQRVQSIMDWRAQPGEVEFYARFPEDSSVWIARKLRYCPCCLEQGYHSFWHQLLAVSRCPLHRVALSTRCTSCGADLPDYGLTRPLLVKPYHCPACGAPLSGVAPDLNRHLAFRRSVNDLIANDLMRAFHPLESWWHATAAIRREAAQYNGAANIFIHTLPGDWCDRDTFVRDLCCAMAPVPKDFIGSQYRDITILSYRLQSLAPFSFDPMFPGRWHYDAQRTEMVYRATLRYLEQWIAQYEDVSPVEYARHAGFAIIQDSDGKCVDANGYQARLFALCLMRWQLECDMGHGDLPEARRARIFRSPFIEKYEVRRDTPRLTWRALFVGIYIAWYHRVLAAHAIGQVIRLTDLSRWNAAYVFSYYSPHWDEVRQPFITGRLAFPSIQGLDSLLRGGMRHRMFLTGAAPSQFEDEQHDSLPKPPSPRIAADPPQVPVSTWNATGRQKDAQLCLPFEAG